jgi:hypothetical protein
MDEAFLPIFELDAPPEKGKGSHWAVRIGIALALAGSIWALQSYAPDKGVPAPVSSSFSSVPPQLQPSAKSATDNVIRQARLW